MMQSNRYRRWHVANRLTIGGTLLGLAFYPPLTIAGHVTAIILGLICLWDGWISLRGAEWQ